MSSPSVCKGCEKREVGCHSTCETYIKAKDEYEAQKAIIREQREYEAAMNRLDRQRKQKKGRNSWMKNLRGRKR